MPPIVQQREEASIETSEGADGKNEVQQGESEETECSDECRFDGCVRVTEGESDEGGEEKEDSDAQYQVVESLLTVPPNRITSYNVCYTKLLRGSRSRMFPLPMHPCGASTLATMQIGNYRLQNNLVLAPMAGVTDRPFRLLCRRMGAGLAVSEMVSSNSLLWGSAKTRRRTDHAGEPEPRSVQIMGADPALMADAARFNADNGAQIIDINMGCPAKKVCNVAAGSARITSYNVCYTKLLRW